MVDIYSWESNEVVIQLKLDRASSRPVTVNYAVAFESPAPCTHTSASADDFENLNTRPLTGTVTFAPGAVEQFAFVDTADDTTWEGNEAIIFLNAYQEIEAIIFLNASQEIAGIATLKKPLYRDRDRARDTRAAA